MLASVGATRRQIKSSVKTEAAMLGVVGIPVGTMSGILASLILVKVVNALSAGWLNFALSFHITACTYSCCDNEYSNHLFLSNRQCKKGGKGHTA